MSVIDLNGGRRHTMHAIIAQGPRRVREILSEIDYAQRRLFEIRTGVSVTGEGRRRRMEDVAELEAQFALEIDEPTPC
jgi:hypothetical protein